MSLRTVRQTITDWIHTVKPEWTLYNTIPPVILPPCVIIQPSDDTFVNYQVSMGGMRKWYFKILIALPFTEMGSSQDVLDDELSPDVADGIVARLMRDSTLGDTVRDTTIMTGERYGRADTGSVGSVPFIGAAVKIEVIEC